MVKTEAFTAENQEPVTLNDIATMDLFHIRHFSQSDDTFENWQHYAEDECNIAFDWYSQFPFFLTVWVNDSAEQARLVLFSDHYMSDGYSGMPLLPVRSGQHDFVIPPVANPTSACFAEGDPGCMRKTVAKCKTEGVTFAGALVNAVVVAFYKAAKSQPDFDPEQPFKFMVDLDYNMRRRVPHVAEDDHVGAIIAFADLEWLVGEGVNMNTTLFWDLARRSKKEIDENLQHKKMVATVTVSVDQLINAKMELSFAEDVQMPSSLNSDANISDVGKYPYARGFSLTFEIDKDEKRALIVKCLHVCIIGSPGTI
ncbi:uncharacterized protein PITG_07859 [Phytophthora infestans T30-4]|uniref:Uncharacterized protein n=1 Tax=Phytophthora infestans (strain T30-4) TaxID=403677 RepID=D0NA02_PHYIT|nr:uncharacterized protein PITG_07859 [Phytophthora infestans T30-4]EEY54256.1 conserved hypothetical protein [Phytophthora infestans T30-4]|eukprot:XP_002904078.1 conserved hypothetical protein [Phytophthora infestans T30-4]